MRQMGAAYDQLEPIYADALYEVAQEHVTTALDSGNWHGAEAAVRLVAEKHVQHMYKTVVNRPLLPMRRDELGELNMRAISVTNCCMVSIALRSNPGTVIPELPDGLKIRRREDEPGMARAARWFGAVLIVLQIEMKPEGIVELVSSGKTQSSHLIRRQAATLEADLERGRASLDGAIAA
jgi:hypothetical protein